MRIALLVVSLFSSFVFAAAPNREVQRVQLYNGLIVTQDYIANLYAGQVSGFPESEIYPGSNLKICGDGLITSEKLVEDEFPYDGAVSYLSFPTCANSETSNYPFMNFIVRCDMDRVRCGRYCHSIRASCDVVSVELIK